MSDGQSYTILPLGLYTAMAERIISDAIELGSNTKIFRNREHLFNSGFGCFGRKFFNSFVGVSQYGELLLSPTRKKDLGWNYTKSEHFKLIPEESSLEFKQFYFSIIKGFVEAFLSLYKVKQSYYPESDAKDVIECSEAIIKHFSGEELTEEEWKWIGRPMTPFEYVGFKEILDKGGVYTNPTGAKLRAYLKKVQKA